MHDIKPCAIPCPICGSLDIYRRYYKIGKYEKLWSYGEKIDEYKTDYVDYQRYALVVKIPVIINACRTCGNNWESATLLKEKKLVTKKDIQKALKNLKQNGNS